MKSQVMHLMARYHLCTHISTGRTVERSAKREIPMELTAKGAVQGCRRTRDRTLRKGWNHKRCGYSTQPVMSEVTQLRQTIELINPCSTLTSTFFWRTSVYSLAMVHGCVSVQRSFISSKNKMYRQLLAVFLVSPEGSGDCKPDFTYYKIQ